MSAAAKGPKIAMVLAAGLGTRMRPLTNDRPKALVEVGGKALIDHMLDRLAAAGVEAAVVNVHYFADLVEAHLKAREAKGLRPRIVISDERPQALETGGGIKHALPLLGESPVFVANIDSIWIERAGAAIDALATLSAASGVMTLRSTSASSASAGPDISMQASEQISGILVVFILFLPVVFVAGTVAERWGPPPRRGPYRSIVQPPNGNNAATRWLPVPLRCTACRYTIGPGRPWSRQ